jgi:hypothetical protein
MLQTTAALALLLGFCGLSSHAQLTYLKLFLYPVLFLPLLVMFLLPAGALVYKLSQCLLGRLPLEELDAEPIRFDSPEPSDED